MKSVWNDNIARDLQPVLKQRGIDASKIKIHLQVAVIEIRQRRVRADDATDCRGPRQQDRTGGSMVRAGTVVLFQAATEFAERQQHDTILKIRRREIIEECLRCIRERAEQAFVSPRLSDMRIVSRLGNVVDSR